MVVIVLFLDNEVMIIEVLKIGSRGDVYKLPSLKLVRELVPTLAMLKKLAKVLNVDIDDLIYY